MVMMFATSISNAVNHRYRDKREADYMAIIRLYPADAQKRFGEMFNVLVQALDLDPGRDFFGDMFMQLELSSHWHGQFFTPGSLCTMMAKINIDGIKEQIDTHGWSSVNDCACGAGAMLLAAAQEIQNQGVNYQDHVLFVGQDIDQTSALMCYTQLSLMGCPGYVKISDTLKDPITGGALWPPDGENTWVTPMFLSDTWHWRRVITMFSSTTQEGG
jgi:type I restriction-modification system DNA methylase subunit